LVDGIVNDLKRQAYKDALPDEEDDDIDLSELGL
jgi:hypothetical protein